jgi:hypothetical protein
VFLALLRIVVAATTAIASRREMQRDWMGWDGKGGEGRGGEGRGEGEE